MGTQQMILIYIVIILVMFVPQLMMGRKKRQKQLTMLNELKIGDKIVTIGGIHGTISAVQENTLEIKIDSSSKMTISKSAVSRTINN